MSNVRLHNVPQLGLQRQEENTNIHKAQRLGINSNQLDYKDGFTSISPNKIKLFINHLNDSSYFKLKKFDSKDYCDQNFLMDKLKEQDIELSSVKIDNTKIAQDRIPSKLNLDNEQLLHEIEESYYDFLSKSILINTSVSFIDNDVTKNGYRLNIDKEKKSIDYTYSIYYKASDELIKRVNSTIQTNDRYRAIIVKTGGVGTLFFFLEKVYGKDIANNLRYAIYERFKTELEKTSDIETLAFLYDNLPNYIKLGYDDKEDIETKPYKLTDKLLWEHLQLFINYDKGFKDASYFVLKVLTMISPKFCMQKFIENQSLVIDIYNGLDDQSPLNEFFGIYKLSKTFDSGVNTFEPTNKDFFVTILNSYIQLYENDPTVAIFESSGAHFHQGTKKGGKYDIEVKFTLNSNIIFSDDKKDKILINNYWESKQYLGQAWDSQGKIYDRYEYDRGYNESGYYNPLDVVKFTQYNDKGEAITINVPVIFVKHASDVKEWEKVNEGIRFGVNVLMIIAGTATIVSGAGSLLLYAAIADMGLATTDIIIQSKKDEAYFKSKQGKEFLENWEKIYTVGGVITFSPVAIKAVATYGPKIVSSGADLLQVTGKTITNPEIYKKVKDLTTKAIHSLEIPNFNKTGLEILKKGFTNFSELKNTKNLQNLGVLFVKGGEDTVAVIYKGVVIASGKAKDVARKLYKAINKSGKQLEKYLNDLLKWKTYKSLIGTGGLIKYQKVLSRNMIGQEKGMACAAACIEQLTIDYKLAKKYSQFDIFDLAEAGIETGMNNTQIEKSMIGVFGKNRIKSAGYGSYKGVEVFKDIAKYVSDNGETWVAIVREETRHAILVDKIIGNKVYIRDPWPLEGLEGIKAGKPGVEAILDLDYFAKIWEQTGGIMIRVK